MKMITKKSAFKVLVLLLITIALSIGLYSAYFVIGSGKESTFGIPQQNKIFLGTKFGFGVKETAEALALLNAQLLNADQYLAVSDIKLLELNTRCIPIHPSWEKWEEYYMPAIILFESFVEADFNFVDDKLVSLGVQFSPFAKSKSQLLVDTLDQEFKTKYVFEKREESATVAGAYTLVYHKNKVILHLWINLTDAQSPIIIAYICDDFSKANRDEKRKQIDSLAF
jgi:hypothetical protein